MAQMDSASLSIQLTAMPCDASCRGHENIHSYRASVISSCEAGPIGYVKLSILEKNAMEANHPNRMWQECEAYDEAHPGAKLDRIENYLFNESFEDRKEQVIVDAKAIVYIQAVWLEPSERGRGRGLTSLLSSVAQLRLPDQAVLLLEAGPMEPTDGDSAEAGDKLARHWGRLGFEVWSDSDPNWLCAELKALKQYSP